MRISKTFTFDAAHHLPGYKGPCVRVHGHGFKVEVVLFGIKDPKTGMIMDFKVLKRKLEPIIEWLDHQNLNDFFSNPTAENIAEAIFRGLVEDLDEFKNVHLEEVKVWESPTSMASYDFEDYEGFY